jgi:hypothetical protein
MDYPHRMQFPSWLSQFDAPPPRDDPPVPRITLAGSLDPTTGIFYRTPEHPRLRTAQACEKCRARKAKVWAVSLSCLVLSAQKLLDSARATTHRAPVVSRGACRASTQRRGERGDPTSPSCARGPPRAPARTRPIPRSTPP